MHVFYISVTFLIVATCKLAAAGIDPDEIRRWVDGHNIRRLKVAEGLVKGQPSASEMNAVMWDNELYAKAQAYADTYPNRKHNPDKTVPSGRFPVGENLYQMSTTDLKYELDPDVVLQFWFIEHQNFTFGPIRNSEFDPSKPKIGHYTQLVWADTTYIGCGSSHIYTGEMKTFYVVCNYAPVGNILGENPYKVGGPATHLTCGCGKQCNYCTDLYKGKF